MIHHVLSLQCSLSAHGFGQKDKEDLSTDEWTNAGSREAMPEGHYRPFTRGQEQKKREFPGIASKGSGRRGLRTRRAM
jgi:hypothetical protein